MPPFLLKSTFLNVYSGLVNIWDDDLHISRNAKEVWHDGTN